MNRRRTILLAALGTFFASSSAVSPAAASVGPPTYIVNEQSNLTTFLVAPECHNFDCLNGKPFHLGSGSDNSYFTTTRNSANFLQFHWTTSKCIDTRNGSNEDGTPVVLNDCNGSSSQLWFPARSASTGFFLINGAGGGCLDAQNAAFPNPPAVGAPLQIWGCANSSSPWRGNQIWKVDF
ncbi:RICIN domain-containing protein [Streptomyces mirabilis]|uniref:RICIN domain-containing protein n=1 Tax=Streptomyces mirabilis TaxID=68239 RepID=UPI0033211C1B